MELEPEYNSDYVVPSVIFKNSFLQTIFARFFRPDGRVPYQRERITLDDEDFLDLDWSKVGSKSLAVISPGFEGNSKRVYVEGAVRALNDSSMDAVVVNLRGCSGATSKKFIFGTGDENDFSQAVDYILTQNNYEKLFIVGYSTGGNLVVKYAADKSEKIDPRIQKVFAVSALLDLPSLVVMFSQPSNILYLMSFMFFMFQRAWENRSSFDWKLKLTDFLGITNPLKFYNKFCYPFTQVSFLDYLDRHSAIKHLDEIAVPTMIVHSFDDPFLDIGFYMDLQNTSNEKITVLLSRHGGHAGFVDFGSDYFWAERKMIEFFNP